MQKFPPKPNDRTLALALPNQLHQTEDLAKAALNHYQLPRDLTISLINLSENATYKVEHLPSGQRWALRIHRPGYHSSRAIASEIAWQIDLRSQRVVTTPVPVKGTDGEYIQLVSHPPHTKPRHIVLYEWESGHEPDVGHDLRHSFETLGAVTARMHLHAKTWKRPPDFERLTWSFETSLGSVPHWGRWQEGIGVDSQQLALFGKAVELIRQRLERYGDSPNRFGLIHCDLRLANLLIDGSLVKVIDFDDCGFGWYMYDAATPVSFYEHLPEVPDWIGYWLKGYKTVSDISPEDEEEIPTFIMLRRLLLVAWIGSHHYTDLAKSMGVGYTEGTVHLCHEYLKRFG
jgi:Ser/Thr protein kinase RdoA (MazF antagonist)